MKKSTSKKCLSKTDEISARLSALSDKLYTVESSKKSSRNSEMSIILDDMSALYHALYEATDQMYEGYQNKSEALKAHAAQVGGAL